MSDLVRSIAYQGRSEAIIEGNLEIGFRLRIFKNGQCVLDRSWSDPIEPMKYAESEYGFLMFHWRTPFEHPNAPNWQFSVRERSAGVWEFEGRDPAGRSVSRIGTDYNEMRQACIDDALAMIDR